MTASDAHGAGTVVLKIREVPMDFTPAEQRFLQPYLAMQVADGKGWIIGVALGVLVCAAAVLLRVSGVWPGIGPYVLLIVVAGLIVIEQSVNRRDKVRLARILQKYDTLARRPQHPDEEEETI
ncbi:MAG: hypothetical protein ACYTFZ_00770 [Planctomycetota bacterium]|jgi:hypothetical protein